MKSSKNYYSELLQESSVTGVPSIAASKGGIRKFLKLLILCSGVAGFLIQAQEFLDIYWEYSTVRLQEKLVHLKKPAITICDENIISREYYCENNPKKCTVMPTMFCLPYCIDASDYYSKETQDAFFGIHKIFSEEFYNISVTKASGFKVEQSILQCEWSPNVTLGEENSIWASCGKPQFVRGMNEQNLPAACYTLKTSDFVEELKSDSMLRMILRWRMSDHISVKPHSYISEMLNFWIDFHHPGHVSNPFSEGVQISQGRAYKIHLTQVDTIRLPPPYSTKCFDYEEEWRKNNFKGPRGREDCENTCDVELNFEKFGCVPKTIYYPHDKELCMEYKPYDADLKEKVRKCKEQCGDACAETKYFTLSEVSGQFSPNYAYENYGYYFVSVIEIFFDTQNSKTVIFKPKYQSVELFSYIGGYLGMWLGWSLVAVFDFVEILFNMCMHSFTLRRNHKKKTRRPEV